MHTVAPCDMFMHYSFHFPELDTPSLGERDTSHEPGLTQERTKDFLVITVKDPKIEVKIHF